MEIVVFSPTPSCPGNEVDSPTASEALSSYHVLLGENTAYSIAVSSPKKKD